MLSEETLRSWVERGTALSDEEGRLLFQHCYRLTDVERLQLWASMSKCCGNDHNLELAKSVHRWLNQLVTEVFGGVPPTVTQEVHDYFVSRGYCADDPVRQVEAWRPPRD